VVAGFAAETGDPTGTGRGGTGTTLAAEFSDERFVRGTVGMKHANGHDDSADSQFLIIYDRAPHLGGKYTVWGQVIYVMEYAALLKRGQPPREPDRILQLRVASDITE
jgi:peptidylprolyl isomerase